MSVTYSLEPAGVLADGPVNKVSEHRATWPGYLVCKCGIFFKLSELLDETKQQGIVRRAFDDIAS